MTTSMYCLYVGFDYTYIDINTLEQWIKSFFGLTRLVSSRCWGSICPQLLVSHANHSAIKTSLCMYICMYVCMCVCVCVCTCVRVHACVCVNDVRLTVKLVRFQ